MRICHVITGLNVGGAERALHTLLSGGLASLHDCHVISLSDAGHYGPLISELGVPVHCLNMSPGRGSARALLRLHSLLRNIKPDVLHGWMYHGNLAATVGAFAMFNRPRTVWSVRQSLYDIEVEKRMTRAIIRASTWLSHGASAILYNSQISRSHHEALGFSSRRGRVIPNGFDLDTWRPDPVARKSLRSRLGLDKHTPLVGYVGRFHPLKDIPNLLSALEQVMKADPVANFALVGLDLGPDNPLLTSLHQRLPRDRVHVLGPTPDMPQVYPAFDVLCLCSRSEGFPNVIGEAMAAGVPVVVTDVGDNADVVGATGWVVPAEDSVALAQGILDALKEPAATRARRAEHARQRINSRFSLGAALDQYNQTYLALGADD